MNSELAHLKGYHEACEVVYRYQSPRYKRLQILDDYVEGRQYGHLCSWWSEAPLWERAPCIVDPIVKTSITSNVSLVLGSGRYPTATARPDEDNDDEGLDEEASEHLDELVEQVEDAARYPAHCREALEQAQGTGTAVGLFGVRKGRPFAELVKAQWCERDVDQEGNVTRLEIGYPFVAPDAGEPGKVAAYLYRREITDSQDITYKPAKVDRDGRREPFTPSLVVTHGLGFCPVIWYSFMRGCGMVTQIDGHAVHENILEQLDSLNYALSQKQHAAIFCGEPQPYEIGVDENHCPTGEGDIVDKGLGMYGSGGTGMYTGAPGAHGSNYRVRTTGKKGRKKGPGWVWRYPSADTKVGYLEVSSDSLKAIEDHCRDIRGKIAESLAFVGLDPEQIKFAATVSGKAMEALKSRQLDRCDQIRDDFGDGYLLPGIDMLLRIVYTLTKRGQRVDLPSLQKTIKVLDQFAQGA